MTAETGGTQTAFQQENRIKEREYSRETADTVASLAQHFLAMSGAQTIDRGTIDSIFKDNKHFKHENPIETLINAKDPTTNTSFLIEKSPSITNEKGYYVSIKWLTLGTDKGILPSGHITVHLRPGKEPVVVTNKIPAMWAIPENDGYWEHTGGKHCFDEYSGPNNVTDDEVKDILERLRRATVDGKQSEHTAQLDIYDTCQAAYATALHTYREIKKTSNWKTIGAVILAEMEFRKKEKEWEKFKEEWKRKMGVKDELNKKQKEDQKTKKNSESPLSE